MTQGSDRIISASDVEKYAYCPLSWWLSELKVKENEEELRKGSQSHAMIGKDVKKIKVKEKLSEESERYMLWFSLIAIVIGINGAAIIYPISTPSYQGVAVMVLLSVIAVLWVVVAALFFYFGIKRDLKAKRERLIAAMYSDSLTDEKGKPISPHESEWKKRFTEAKVNMALFFVVSGVLAMQGIIILLRVEQFQSQILSQILLTLSLVWLIGSSFFYYIALRRDIASKGMVKPEDSKGAEKTDDTKDSKKSFSDSEVSVILLAVIATILASTGLAMYQSPPTLFGRIILTSAILWLYGGFIFLYRALRANVRLKILMSETLKEAERIQLEGETKEAAEFEHKTEEDVLDYERGVIWFAVIAMVLALNAIIMNFSKNLGEYYGPLIARLLGVVALVWLLGAGFFLFTVLKSSRIAARLREVRGVKEGKIEYVDTLDEESKMLFSEKYGLRGRPDYILKKNGDLVPVEVKTGRVPRGPLFSHILQLAAYCLLIEDKYEQPPSYGIIKYGDIQHKIDYTEELKKTLGSKLSDMRRIMMKGEAHRNHKRPNKCRGCSRREICPEALV